MVKTVMQLELIKMFQQLVFKYSKGKRSSPKAKSLYLG